MMALAAALLVVGLSVGWWYSSRIPTLPVLARFENRHGSGHYPLAFSKDGSLLAVGSRRIDTSQGTQIWEAATGKLRSTLMLPEGHGPLFVVFSPDGRTIVVSSRRWSSDGVYEGSLAAYDTSNGSVRARLDVPFDTILYGHFSPDGATLEVTGFDLAKAKAGPSLSPVQRAWETTTWTERAPDPIPKIEGANITFVAPDGQGVIRTSRESPIFTYVDLSREDSPVTPLRDVASTPSGTHVVWFSADGRMIARGRTDNNLEFWDLETKRLRSSLKGRDFAGYESWIVTVSPDPNLFLSAEREYPPQTMTPSSAFRSWVRRFFRIQKKYRTFVTVRDSRTGRPLALLKDQAAPVLTRDGKVLATVGLEDSTVTLWQMPSK
jgi:WD40 repeat protein